jgi:hypothetical protein
MLESNAEVAAVLDVYALLGGDAMSAAYRRILPLRPVPGELLTRLSYRRSSIRRRKQQESLSPTNLRR